MAKRTTAELRSEAADADDAGYSTFGDTVRECAAEIDFLTAQLTAERARAERLRSILAGVVAVADRKTAEFDAARAAIDDTTEPPQPTEREEGAR